MQHYFRNTELLKLHPSISESTIRNWIKRAQAGRLDLQLYEEAGKMYVANTADNVQKMEDLVRRGRKYLRKRDHKLIAPSSHFYELYTPSQVLDIITNIDKHREIPLQYAYYDDGADYFDKYTQKLLRSDISNTLTSTIKLLELAESAIANLTSGHKRINVVDLGVGNATPVRSLLDKLLTQGRLNRYMAVDNSKAMLEIAERNIKTWFGGKVPFEGHVRDFVVDRLDDLLATDSFDDSDCMNLVLLLGGTLSNLREPDQVLQLIHHSMGRDDLLVFTKKLDMPHARTFFDFNPDEKVAPLPPIQKMLPDLLNIDATFYDVEQGFDPINRSRYIRIRLKVRLSIVFEFGDRQRTVTLEKGETLLLWRATHQNTFDVISQFDRNNFELLNTTKTRDNEYILLAYEARNDIAR